MAESKLTQFLDSLSPNDSMTKAEYLEFIDRAIGSGSVGSTHFTFSGPGGRLWEIRMVEECSGNCGEVVTDD